MGLEVELGGGKRLGLGRVRRLGGRLGLGFGLGFRLGFPMRFGLRCQLNGG